MSIENVNQLFIMPKDFFDSEGLEERIKNKFTAFQGKLYKVDRESFKNELNSFYMICMNVLKDEKLIYLVRFHMYDILNQYGTKYRSEDTFRNVIKEIELKEVKERLFTLFPYKARYAYADALFSLYNLENDRFEGKYSSKRTELILKCKFNLLKIYDNHLTEKFKINDGQLERMLVLLSGCLSQFSRWFEPVYYLNLLTTKESQNPNINYMRALNLRAIKDKTCLDYNGILLLEIIDCCLSIKKNQYAHPEQIAQLNEIEKECRDQLRKYGPNISELRKHKRKYKKNLVNFNPYQNFCHSKQLYINEHSFFCNCKLTTKDNLETKTNHQHTQTEWVESFEPFIDSIIFDFVTARQLFFRSQEGSQNSGFHIRDILRKNSKRKIKDVLLKQSFKMCYSILDQICQGIFQVMDIEHEKILKEKSKETGNPVPKLYFLNMWDFGLFSNKRFEENFYLISLYSISKDLDRYSALKNFKKIRNALEHNVLFVEDSYTGSESNRIARKDLEHKTELLMILTKSAIYSFNNLIRRESKVLDMKKL